jgi:hypothetical protein
VSARADGRYFAFQAIVNGDVRNINLRLPRAPVVKKRDAARSIPEKQTWAAAERLAEERG